MPTAFEHIDALGILDRAGRLSCIARGGHDHSHAEGAFTTADGRGNIPRRLLQDDDGALGPTERKGNGDGRRHARGDRRPHQRHRRPTIARQYRCGLSEHALADGWPGPVGMPQQLLRRHDHVAAVAVHPLDRSRRCGRAPRRRSAPEPQHRAHDRDRGDDRQRSLALAPRRESRRAPTRPPAAR